MYLNCAFAKCLNQIYLDWQLWKVSKISKHSFWTWRNENVRWELLQTHPLVFSKTECWYWNLKSVYLLYTIKFHLGTSNLQFAFSSKNHTCNTGRVRGTHDGSSGKCYRLRWHWCTKAMSWLWEQTRSQPCGCRNVEVKTSKSVWYKQLGLQHLQSFMKLFSEIFNTRESPVMKDRYKLKSDRI